MFNFDRRNCVFVSKSTIEIYRPCVLFFLFRFQVKNCREGNSQQTVVRSLENVYLFINVRSKLKIIHLYGGQSDDIRWSRKALQRFDVIYRNAMKIVFVS